MMTFQTLAKKISEASHLRGTFRLRSGSTSDQYFDKYRFESDPHLLWEIAQALAGSVPTDCDALAGLELGGIPIATMVSHITGKPTLFVRKKPKDYGTCRFAEGGDVSGRRLVIVEDVVTTGGQILESVRALRSEGATITDVMCVIDRQAGGKENLRQDGLSLISLFTKVDLLG